MARETKAEREAREAMVREAMLAEQAATYPARLMALMQRAQAVNFEVALVGMTFVLRDRDRDDYDYTKVELDYTYSDVADEDMSVLEWGVDVKEQAALEAERKRNARANALNKLSQEERELLGL